LWKYGHDLDPRAAITLPTFMPPVVGYSKMANFKVLSLPHVGTVLLGLAWALGPVTVWLERRDAARAKAAGMPPLALLVVLGLASGVAGSITATPAQAARVVAAPGGAALAAALAAAVPGDTVVVAPGIHRGAFRIDDAITLVGQPGAVLDGAGRGSVLTIAAGGATVSGLEVRGSGAHVLTVDAGIQVVRSGGVTIRRVRMRDVLYGVYAERAPGLRVLDCDLRGRVPPLKEDGEGNGVHLWYADAPVIAGNRIERFVDGVYLSFVNRAELRGNRLAGARGTAAWFALIRAGTGQVILVQLALPVHSSGCE
jgi:hypothetical protein